MIVCIVSGASSGIGEAIALELQRRGVTVINASRKRNEKISYNYQIDLCNEDEIKNFANWVEDRFDRLDCLVNNAGVMLLKNLYEYSLEDYNNVMNTNLRACYLMCREFIPLLLKGDGKIINIASISGTLACPDDPIYGVSKAGLISLTKSLAVKYAGKLAVNCISPGYISGTKLIHGGGPTPKELVERIPIKREGTPEEVAKVVADMLEWSKYITGVNLQIDGGLSCCE